ncbi:MAG: MurR/RpiR family transcriptional regulator [Bryobacteraceae bacterium]
MSSRRQEVIGPALENPPDYVLLSIRSVAERLGTDPATVVRLVHAMGFSDSKAFKTQLHELALAQGTALDSMHSGLTPEASIDQPTRGWLQQDSKNLSALRHTLDMKRIAGAGQANSRRPPGSAHRRRLSREPGSYLEYQMTVLNRNVLAGTTSRTIHVARSSTSKDVAGEMGNGPC